jgi:hypothetical protein
MAPSLGVEVILVGLRERAEGDAGRDSREDVDHPQFEGPRPEVPMPNSQDSMSLRRFTLAVISCNLLNGAGGLQKDERALWTRQTRARCCS